MPSFGAAVVVGCQIAEDGQLTEEFRARVLAARSATRMSLNKLAQLVDLSGVYLGQVLRANDPKPLRSIHVPRLVRVIEDLEKGRSPTPVESRSAGDTLEDLVRRAHALGFEVSFRPLEK